MLVTKSLNRVEMSGAKYPMRVQIVSDKLGQCEKTITEIDLHTSG